MVTAIKRSRARRRCPHAGIRGPGGWRGSSCRSGRGRRRSGRGSHRRSRGSPRRCAGRRTPSTSGAKHLRKAQFVRGAVGVDGVELRVDQLADPGLDAVADGAHIGERQAGRVGDVPALDHGWDVGAGVAATHGHRPVGMQLHLDEQLARFALRQVDTDLGHRLHDRGPDLLRRVAARRLGADVGRRVALEERLSHLRAPGVVVAHEQHVPHGCSSRGSGSSR